MDDTQRTRIHDDLLGFFEGELLFDDFARSLYSTDASVFQVTPAGVAVPKHEADVQALVRYCDENNVPLIPRGAGTGVAGESLGEGIIVDLSTHFRQIVDVGVTAVRVQPGVVLSTLQTELARHGRRFAPDPATAAVCTIGGMIANDASGARALRHGYTRDHVARLRVVLDNGEAADFGIESAPGMGRSIDRTPHVADLLLAVAVLLEQNALTISQAPVRTPFDRCGYRLKGILHDGLLDLPRLLVGSEGTLGIFTEATLQTIPLAGGRSVVLLGVASLDEAFRTIKDILATGPSACELLDRRFLTLARGAHPTSVAAAIPPSAEAVLLVEYEADSPDEAQRSAESLLQVLHAGRRAVVYQEIADTPERQAQTWQLREGALPSLYGLKGRPQPTPFIEDVAVPVDHLREYLRRVQDVLQEHETTASFFIHAGAGQVHTRPFLNLSRTEDVHKLADLAEKVHSLAIAMNGTVSTQHSTGLARAPWVARQVGPLFPIMRQLKAIFDPKGIFNPGKIVADGDAGIFRSLRSLALDRLSGETRNGSDRADGERADLDPPSGEGGIDIRLSLDRPEADRGFVEKATGEKIALPVLAMKWSVDEFAVEMNHCNGCGMCRTDEPGRRMCPSFRASPDEAATPRAKANLLRHLFSRAAEGKPISSDAVREIADLCVHCKMCEIECPAHVDIPRLMAETRAANVAEHGQSRADWFFTHLEGMLRWGTSYSLLANFFLGSRTARWFLEKVFGLTRKRRMPRLASASFLSIARRRGWTRKPRSEKPAVVYFVDLYANYIDPLLAESAVLVLQHLGFEVHVPEVQVSSGMEAFVAGDLEFARDLARRNLTTLAEFARAGVPIVCTEPSGALMLKQEYLDLVDDVDAAVVAAHTHEFSAFVASLADEGRLRSDFQPLDVGLGYHIPCHVKAQTPSPRTAELLMRIPGVRISTIDAGCSGMAGTHGLKAKTFDVSLAAGRSMLAAFDQPRILFGVSECSSCRMQIEHGSRKRSLHPAHYLALAYGLLPAVGDRLREPVRELLLR